MFFYQIQQRIAAKFAALRGRFKYKNELAEKAHIIQAVNAKLQAYIKDLTQLYEISQELGQSLVLTELLEDIKKIITKKLKYSCFSLSLYDDEGALMVMALEGLAGTFSQVGKPIDDPEALVCKVARTGDGVIVNSALQKDFFLHDLDESKPQGVFYCQPLKISHRVIGVLVVGHASPFPFLTEEKQFLDSLCSQVAMAFDRSLFYMKTKELSVKDELTGVYNRRYFQQELHMEFKRALRFHRPLSLLMIDVDYFKNFNDRYGHLQGDKILNRLAQLILKNVREVDCVARFGGEEFIVLLADTAFAEALGVAEKLRRLVRHDAKSFMQDQHLEELLTVSIGVSTYPDLVDNAEALINTADIALYEAKERGRDNVVGYHLERKLRSVQPLTEVR